jgi:hypothetical protein
MQAYALTYADYRLYMDLHLLGLLNKLAGW